MEKPMRVDQRKNEPVPHANSTSTKQIQQNMNYGGGRKSSNSEAKEFLKGWIEALRRVNKSNQCDANSV